MLWKANQLVWIVSDASLGPAKIIDDSEAQLLQVQILASGERRNYTKKNPPFKRVELHVAQKVILDPLFGEVTIESLELRDGFQVFRCKLGVFSESDISGMNLSLGLLDLLRHKQFSPPKLFDLRREAWELLALRNAHPLRGAIGCRVQTLPHQLWVVDAALKMPKIRALLADEVGLGKTIEAGMIFSALHARQKLSKVLILVPAALKVQWLTESFRRFNIRFRLDHEALIEEDEFRDFVIASLDELDQNREDLDLLIVDEAHRLVHNSEYADRLEAMVASSKHVLFLSATPRVHGDSEFLKLMHILGRSLEGKLAPLLFQSRRSELGLPSFRELEAVWVKDKQLWLIDFIGVRIKDPRKPKVFMIASKAEEVIALHTLLRTKFGEHFALFHENMDLVERDRQAAYFADPEGAQFLVSSEIGGEGRNFQVCHNMILVDLPADPLVVEQRIGRLDRLGQTRKVSVWCPVLEDSEEESIFEVLRDRYHVFETPWSGSGLEDLEASLLLSTSPTHVDLESLQEKGHFSKVFYDADCGNSLMQSASGLEKINVKNFLDSLYDAFGVDVEDFDTRGNWRVSTSSLMFVDHFPGLGDKGERILSFSRDQALAREDMTYFTIDHPEFIESIEFLLNSDKGRFAMGQLPSDVAPDVVLWGLQSAAQNLSEISRIWSCSTQKYLPEPDWDPLELQFLSHPPEAFLKSLYVAVEAFLNKGVETDALLVAVPAPKTS